MDQNKTGSVQIKGGEQVSFRVYMLLYVLLNSECAYSTFLEINNISCKKISINIVRNFLFRLYSLIANQF